MTCALLNPAALYSVVAELLVIIITNVSKGIDLFPLRGIRQRHPASLLATSALHRIINKVYRLTSLIIDVGGTNGYRL